MLLTSVLRSIVLPHDAASFITSLTKISNACDSMRKRRFEIANLLHSHSQYLPRGSCDASAFALVRLGCGDAATAMDRIDREQRDAERRRGNEAVGELLGILIRHGAVRHKVRLTSARGFHLGRATVGR